MLITLRVYRGMLPQTEHKYSQCAPMESTVFN